MKKSLLSHLSTAWWTVSKKTVSDQNLSSKKVSIGTVHTFQGKEADTVIFVLGCDRNTGVAVKKFVDKNIVNVAASRAKANFFVVGDAQAWAANEYIMQMKSILDTYAIKLAVAQKDKIQSEISSAIKESLPNAFSEEISEGVDNSIITTDAYTTELKKVFDCASGLSKEEMEKFNLSKDDFDGISDDNKKNLILGIKLYGVLKKVFDSLDKRADFDATCCSVLFCKFLENYLKKTLLGTLKKVFPDFVINKKQKLTLSKMKEEKITMGSFVFILKENTSKVSDLVKDFTKDLNDCVTMRNRCCHQKSFPWLGAWSHNNGQNVLLTKMFGNRKNYIGVFQRINDVNKELSKQQKISPSHDNKFDTKTG